MNENLVPYEYWDPQPLKRFFEGMIITGTTETVLGTAFDNRRVVHAGIAFAIAGATGRIILALLGY
ncbi:hypothetical protein ES702_07454 [subsurface metagenome]